MPRRDERARPRKRLEALVTRSQAIAVLGLAVLSACSAADPPAERPADAGRDRRTTPRADGSSADRLDANGGSYADETSTPPEPDGATLDATVPPDGTMPPPDAGSPIADGSGPRPDGSGPPADASPPSVDGAADQAGTSCLVTFTVHGVRWEAEGGAVDAQGSRVVRLVGDAANLGSWAPMQGVPLVETTPGTWSGNATFRDQQLTEFKFVKLEGSTPEWESWQPYDSNRSLRVECWDDGGTLRDASEGGDDTGPGDARADGDASPGDAPPDASLTDGAVDASGSDAVNDAAESGSSDALVTPVPARGKSYVGVFGVRPPDATK